MWEHQFLENCNIYGNTVQTIVRIFYHSMYIKATVFIAQPLDMLGVFGPPWALSQSVCQKVVVNRTSNPPLSLF